MRTTAPRPGPDLAGLGRLLLVAAALVSAVLGAVLATAAPADAHAALTGSDPKRGAVVAKAPDQVSLTFSEKVAMSDGSVRVLDPAGKRADTGKTTDLGSTTYGVKLKPGLPDGTFTVAYQVVSADSHPIAGAFTFSIGAPSDTKVALPDQEVGGGLVGTLYDTARYLSYAGFIVVVGGAAFVLGCWPRGAGVRPLQRLVVSGWLALTGATLATLLLRAPYTGSGKLADAFDLAKLGDVLQTKTGAALVSRLLLLAAAALFIAVLFGAYDKREDPKEKRDLAFGLAVGGGVVAIGIAATWALAEHASTGIQAGLAMPVDVLHLLAVAVWLGGVVALLLCLYRAPLIDASAVRRFSGVAFGSVVALAGTGLYQSWRQVGSWTALVETDYGQLLLIKIGLVAVLVGIASVSRRWTGRILAEAGGLAPEAAATAVVEQRTRATTAKNATAGKNATAKGASTNASTKKKKPVAVAHSSKTGVSATVDTDAGTGGTSLDKAKDKPGAKPGDKPAGDDKRAAQLARQRAAVDAAREKRVRDADPHRSGLRRSVLAEVGVAVVLLAVTTALTTTEPGRTEEEAKNATSSAPQNTGPVKIKIPFDTGGQDGKGTVRLELDPGRTGSNDLHVYATRPNGSAFDIPEVKIAFTLKAKDVGPLPVAPDRIATGHWSASGVQIPMAGDWKVAVTVRTSDIDQVTLDKNVQIG
ncbi:Copper transport protein YcnJ precursor [Streptomyces sp. YIM 121038]|uniref:copper resistance CopC/CopD family protein n=1 Tax=Streptomyces sp. YIM 121038 TaxID=2136401 RepID=UPI001110C759|nr:copper resistance protein CopC [Streptomyces sp. YIM 121038]QCX77715.1 Copper transport protein YcnJ precursor [Streptomyces sp. YIM 121038]